ncbi:MAG: hypothetical protein JJLCMIEE_02870 [Acidimicrobiales bacterium]|nr:hypothetical protein [Acidimicrobiales bacterium]
MLSAVRVTVTDLEAASVAVVVVSSSVVDETSALVVVPPPSSSLQATANTASAAASKSIALKPVLDIVCSSRPTMGLRAGAKA